MNIHEPKAQLPWWRSAVTMFMVPVLVAAAAVVLACFAVWTAFLHLMIWTVWCLRGRNVLFVHSDSSVWRDHIDRHILPRLGERAVVLNWSERRRWRMSLARLAFHHFGGHRQFNPLAVVFRPFRPTRTFRFWQPFRDYKHGDPEALRRMESDFFAFIGRQKP